MQPAAFPDNEIERIRKLEELKILDTLEEQAYDDLTLLAAQICDTPIALVSLVDRDRQWFKSHHGLDARETPRDIAFCSHAILSDDIFVIDDASKDERFHDNPLATDKPNVIFYAGVPLVMNDKLRLGTLCVIDNKPRSISEDQKTALKALARQVVSQLELRLRVRELETLDSDKNEFFSMVNHELRTPLTSISGSISLLLNNQIGELNNKQQTMMEITARNSERLLNIINDILMNSALEAGKLQIIKKPQNVIELVEKAVELNEPYCDKCCCKLVFKYDKSDSNKMIDCDESRLLQVLTNLISNAAKVSKDNDNIEISLVSDSDKVRIEVTDHGHGIPKDQEKFIFQKFKQIETSDHLKLPGTGLGLMISKQIIELHGGTIGFESHPNMYTKFYFTLGLLNTTNK